jgi:hypothetical protein
MKSIIIVGSLLALTGCGAIAVKDQMYYDASKSISKDQTMAQTACWTAISDIAKGGDNAAKVGAIALAEKCKVDAVKVEAPKKAWYGL